MSRAGVVDTVTAVVFFTAATVSERFIAGLDWSQVAGSRLAAIPALLLTGRPYGLWRDLLFRRVRLRRPLGATALETLAFVSFQAPVYGLILLAVGASGAEIGAALSSAVVFMLLLSRPFGLTLDAVRRVAGVAHG